MSDDIRIEPAKKVITHAHDGSENGWLVAVGDMPAMAGRLQALAADPATARRMGAAGRARVDEFSARRMVDALEGLYERLLRKAGRS